MRGVLLIFDVDGTLTVGDPPGPIPPSLLVELKRRGFTVGVVGSWSKVPGDVLAELDFHYPGHPEKPRWLSEACRRYSPVIAIYVADEERDREACRLAGITYVRPEDFRARLTGRS